jgi:hypothetical protein
MKMASIIPLGSKNAPTYGHTLEVIIYFVAAALLLQHIFTLDATIGTADAVVALLGACFGLIASCLWTPISALSGLGGDDRVAATVFPFPQRQLADHRDGNDDHSQAA